MVASERNVYQDCAVQDCAGVGPIGIGEILRRIIGKVVVGNSKDEIIAAAGPLQTCSGLKSGIEASIRLMMI